VQAALWVRRRTLFTATSSFIPPLMRGPAAVIAMVSNWRSKRESAKRLNQHAELTNW
jgi:hypothetical protein